LIEPIAPTPANADGPAREWVLACVDTSAYANSVTDHSGWFASHPEVGVQVLHVIGSADQVPGDRRLAGQPERSVDHAVGRLREAGVGPIAWAVETGSLFDIVSRHKAGPIVMGKRGIGSGERRDRLGRQALAIIRDTERPVCLAPKVFLPIHRALVLLDADMAHRRALEFVASDFRLSALPLNVAVVAKPGEDPAAKIECARDMLSRCSADVFPLVNSSLDEAAALCMDTRGADLLILSRAIASSDLEIEVLRMEERGLWGTRTPVLIS
jgi:hypothetical protein